MYQVDYEPPQTPQYYNPFLVLINIEALVCNET